MDLEIIKIAEDTKNNKDINNHTHFSKLKNHLCGDEIQIKLIIKKDTIVEFGYEGESCVYCLAAASLLSKVSINKKVVEINELCDDTESFFEANTEIKNKWKIVNKLFKLKYQSRKECILLPFKALKKIVSL